MTNQEPRKITLVKVTKEEQALLQKWRDNRGISIEDFEDAMNALQEPKTGHWVDGHCSECGCDVPAYIKDWKWQKDMDAKYCPNCGTRMVEQESEGANE